MLYYPLGALLSDCSATRLPRHPTALLPSCPDTELSATGYSAIQLLFHLATLQPGNSATRLLCYRAVLLPGYSATQMLCYPAAWTPSYSVTRLLFYPVVRPLGSLESR